MAYQPASVQTGTASLTHLATVWYDKVAVENLKANLPFVAATSRRKLPNRSGKTIQMFSYSLLAANTTPGSEGTVGVGIAPTTVNRSATVEQYFDFMSFSDILDETAIDPIVENSAAEMGYRAALTANTLARSEFETTASQTGGRIDLSDNEFMSGSIVRQAEMDLRSDDVRPGSGGLFMGIIHPFAAFDLLNDNTAGSVGDVLKRSESGARELQRGIQGFRVTEFAGVRFIETTTTGSTAAFPSGAKVGYHTYVIGQDAVFTVSLGSTEIPQDRNFRLSVKRWSPTVADPAGVIGASIAYNFRFTALRPPGSTIRLRQIRSETSIT
jgi:N4-gp56 family major capsid protein